MVSVEIWILLLRNFNLALFQHEISPSYSLKNVLDIFNDGLEMGCRVIRSSDVNVISCTRACWCIQGSNGDKSVVE